MLPCVRACVLAVRTHDSKSVQRQEWVGGGACACSWLCDWLHHVIADLDATMVLDWLRNGLCHRRCTWLYHWWCRWVSHWLCAWLHWLR